MKKLFGMSRLMRKARAQLAPHTPQKRIWFNTMYGHYRA